MVEISMGLPTRWGANGVVVSIGPIFSVGDLSYFLSVGHGFRELGRDHTVMAFTGGHWVNVGQRVIWGMNDDADFAMIKINADITVYDSGQEEMSVIIDQNPNIQDTLTASTIRPQRGRVQFSGALTARGNLGGLVPGSPVYKDQLTVNNDNPQVIGGDSGMAVWKLTKLAGVEWGIYHQGAQRQDYYATPIMNYFGQITSALKTYYDRYKNDDDPPTRFAWVKEAWEAMNVNRLMFYKKEF